MATKYTLTTAFTAITETSGTIQNVGNELVELASSTNAVEGEGIVLNPSEKRSFKGALSARSMGDAGAVVNVVDFTEAGEGGEEYVLPVASDTTLGGIKISNSFTVANDGTLNIKKSGKTILGAVKSSDDEGKVSVNNDGTMTYNPVGYRQPSTTYEVGNIKYHSALPTGWYLECTTAGISGSGDLTISSPGIASQVTDGTVVWTVRSLWDKFDDTAGYINSNGDLNDAINPGIYIKDDNSTIANSPTEHYAIMATFKTNWSSTVANQLLYERIGSSRAYRRVYYAGTWLPWVQQEEIVAKSIGTNGYIKYASKLIIQWGMISPTAVNTVVNVSLPISFAGSSSYIATVCMWTESPSPMSISAKTSSGFNIYSSDNVTSQRMWFAIGY